MALQPVSDVDAMLARAGLPNVSDLSGRKIRFEVKFCLSPYYFPKTILTAVGEIDGNDLVERGKIDNTPGSGKVLKIPAVHVAPNPIPGGVPLEGLRFHSYSWKDEWRVVFQNRRFCDNAQVRFL